MPDVEPSAATARQLPAAGWYADPQSSSGVRYWDGQRWSDDRSSSELVPAHAGSTRRRLAPWVALAVLLTVGLGGVVVILARHHRRSAPASAAKALPEPAPCTYPERRPSASDVLSWFAIHAHLPTVAAPSVRASIPDGGCSAAAFRDRRVGQAVGFVVAMPSADQANALAQEVGGMSFADYQYVVELDPRASPFLAAYKSALADYVHVIVPPTQPGVNLSP